MGFKDLFIKSEGNDKKPEVIKFSSKFSTDGKATKKTAFIADEVGQFPTNESTSWKPNTTIDCTPYMDSIMEMYEKGFEGLNQAGYDFFEFYKMLHESGIDNPEAYKMAYKMATSMDKTVSKSNLLSQADFYIAEIEKVHRHYAEQGEGKLLQVNTEKENTERGLRNRLQEILAEKQRLEAEERGINSELANVNDKFLPQVKEVECKLLGNTQAKDIILSSIEKVVKGIKNNIN